MLINRPSTSELHGVVDTLGGLYHFGYDRVPQWLDIMPPERRKENPFRKYGVTLLS